MSADHDDLPDDIDFDLLRESTWEFKKWWRYQKANQTFDRRFWEHLLTEEVLVLLEKYDIVPPKKFHKFSVSDQLDHIATRILAQSRTTRSHNEMKEEGILSKSQYDRRLNREVFSNYGSLETIEPQRGVFSRTHVKPGE